MSPFVIYCISYKIKHHLWSQQPKLLYPLTSKLLHARYVDYVCYNNYNYVTSPIWSNVASFRPQFLRPFLSSLYFSTTLEQNSILYLLPEVIKFCNLVNHKKLKLEVNSFTYLWNTTTKFQICSVSSSAYHKNSNLLEEPPGIYHSKCNQYDKIIMNIHNTICVIVTFI